MRLAGVLAGVVLAHVAACYHPDTLDCTVQCAAATDCAPGQSCQGGWCVGQNVSCDRGGNPVSIDASTSATADSNEGSGSPDGNDSAQQLCMQGCSKGTCVGGVCVIDCSAEGACTMDVMCPANLPCRVVCGDHACAKKVVCGTSSSCEVRCEGEQACGDEIQCPMGTCDVTCSGAGSCKRRTKCGMSCSCDVTCSGPMSCMEASECPSGMACRVGNGCTSLLTGCDRCN